MKLSVITPVYNRADCILRCLESVSRQKRCGCDVQHVVVDDGSTDRTTEILRDYAATHPHVKPIFFNKNRGTNAGRNAAIANASGEYCVILDSDDYFTPDAVDVILSVMENNPEYRYYMFTRDDRTEEFDRVYGKGSYVEFEYVDALTGKVKGDYIHVIPRVILQKYPFDEEIRIYESLIIQQIYRDVGKMLFCNKTVVIAERDRPDSVTLHSVRVCKQAIEHKLQAAIYEIKLFGQDYIDFGLRDTLDGFYFEAADNSLLLGKYVECNGFLKNIKRKKKFLLWIISRLHLAPLYRFALRLYLKNKYSYSTIVNP